jgi:hypothetical protein
MASKQGEYMQDPLRLRRWRWPILATTGAVGLAALMLSGCAVGGEACTLKGTANFSPGLAVSKRAVSYTFSGTLTGCHAAAGDATIKSGTVNASGSGASVGCTGGGTGGTATINWSNGQTSNLSFTTSGALNAVTVTGTVTGGEFTGHSVHAVLAFTVSSPTACNTATGVTSATFTGETTPA